MPSSRSSVPDPDASVQQLAELEQAIESANIPALLMVLYQFTGDGKWLEPPYCPTTPKGLEDHDDAGLAPALQLDVRKAALPVLRRLAAGEQPAIPVLSEEQAVKMMSVFLAEPVGKEYGRMMREELARFSGQPLDQYEDTAAPLRPDRNVIVIGMSLAGTVAAKHLQEMGATFEIIERNSRSGGSWLENGYPGAGVDTPSHLYSYSFANWDWSHHFALRNELLTYFDDVIKGLNVNDRISYDTQVLSVTWSDADRRWHVSVKGPDGRVSLRKAYVVITAVGIFGKPKTPQLRGMSAFKGSQFHTAAWPAGFDLKGKKVVVVGTGASAMQVVPAIASETGQLTILQRSPQWVAPFDKFGEPISAGARYMLANFPIYRSWYWVRLFWQFGDKVLTGLRADPNWHRPELAMNARNLAHRNFFLEYIKAQVGDRTDLLDKVVPDYPPYGKRMLLDNGWFKALRRPNVEIVAEGARAVEETGVVTESGRHIEADVIVWATGYDATRFLSSFEVVGREGKTIREAWNDDDPRTYLGVATPGFPNLFMLGGPHSFPGAGSFMFFMELQMRYVRRLLGLMNAQDIASAEPWPASMDEYTAEVDALHDRMVWKHEKVQTYFRNTHGRVCVIMPFLNVEYWNKLRDVELADFDVQADRGDHGGDTAALIGTNEQ